MERKITSELLKWKKDNARKPLLLYGNKQIGKTYSVLEFGEKEYKTVSYINCDNNLPLMEIVKSEKKIEKIILKLSLLSGETILKDDSLIIFDNVNDEAIIKMIKLFGKEENSFHIIAITTLKGNLLKFKGEELQFKNMSSMDFEEYLKALGNSELVDFIRNSYRNNKAMPFHSIALDYYETFLLTGGLPRVVESSINGDSILKQNIIQQQVLDTYKKELLNTNNLIDTSRALEVLNAIPYQLLKSNKKFQYGLMKSGGRSKDYESAIDFLNINGFIGKAYKISDIASPLSKVRDNESFKLYLNDSGLLYMMFNTSKIKFLTDSNMKYIIYENAISNLIISSGYNLYYYQSEGKAEVPFIVQTRAGKIIPIELVNKNIAKSKSLALFMSKYKIDEAIRITEENFSKKKNVRYIPVYALFCLKESL